MIIAEATLGLRVPAACAIYIYRERERERDRERQRERERERERGRERERALNVCSTSELRSQSKSIIYLGFRVWLRADIWGLGL